jgi:hypothetical protein
MMRLTALLAASFIGGSALAQESPPAPPAATPPPAPAPAPPAATPPPAPAPPAVPPAPADAEEEEKDGVRFRGGFLIGGGPFLVPGLDVNGGGAMLNFRLGAQITHLFAVYYQGQGIAGALVGSSGALALAGGFNNVMVGLTLVDLIELGLGPSVDILAGAGISTSGAGAGAEVRPGADARVAFLFGGGPDPGRIRRSGFSIGADVHPTFLDGGVLIAITVGVGGEWY